MPNRVPMCSAYVLLPHPQIDLPNHLVEPTQTHTRETDQLPQSEIEIVGRNSCKDTGSDNFHSERNTTGIAVDWGLKLSHQPLWNHFVSLPYYPVKHSNHNRLL